MRGRVGVEPSLSLTLVQVLLLLEAGAGGRGGRVVLFCVKSACVGGGWRGHGLWGGG